MVYRPQAEIECDNKAPDRWPALFVFSSLSSSAAAEHAVDNLLRHFAFGGKRQGGLATVPVDQRDNIRIDIESCAGLRDIVGDNQVQVLLGQLLARVFGKVFGFGGKTYQ